MSKHFVKTLVLSLIVSFSSQASHAIAMGSKEDIDAGKSVQNVRELVDPALLPALEYVPPQFANITRDSVAEARALLNNMMKPRTTEGVSVTKKQIGSPEGDITVYIYQPENAPQDSPGLLWIHGGGYIMGNADTNDFAGDIAKELNATVVSVDYRLAPEHPFPAGLHDSHAALLWMVDNAKELGIDTSRVAIGGDSAGAGMTAGLALYNRDKNGPEIALQLLIYPMLDNLHDTPSGSVEDYPVWNRTTSFNAWEMYLNGTPGAKASPYASASRAKDVSGLPKTFITIGAVDLFRDEAIDYAQRLMAAGVPTQLAVFPGVYHGGQMFVPTATVSQRMINTYMSALKDALSNK